MNTSEFLAWLCADRDIAFQIWRGAHLRAHPDRWELPDYKLCIYYTVDPQIKGYWRSQLGSINRWLILFWMRVKNPQIRRRLYWLMWRLKMAKTTVGIIWNKILF